MTLPVARVRGCALAPACALGGFLSLSFAIGCRGSERTTPPPARVERSVGADAPARGEPLIPEAAPLALPSPVLTGAWAARDASGLRCAWDRTFPSPWHVPEASAAAEVELRAGIREILVVSDSGRRGASMVWSPGAAAPRPITLELDALASDDMEGMAWVAQTGGGHLYTLTSSGAVRRYAPDESGAFVRDRDAYRIGPPPLSCPDLSAVNCGKNWEGLCLRSRGRTSRCAGYVASKTETALYCVVYGSEGELTIDRSRAPMHLALGRLFGKEGVLSDCAFGAEGPAEDVLLVTTNIYGGSATYAVDESTGRVAPLDVSTTPSNEAIAVDSEGMLRGVVTLQAIRRALGAPVGV